MFAIKHVVNVMGYFQAKEVIRYLEFCVYKQGCSEQAIHNFLLSLYASYKKDEVMHYIGSQGTRSKTIFLLCFFNLEKNDILK